MKRRYLWVLALALFAVVPTFADTVVLHDGSSYSGQFTGTANGVITFTDGGGVQYSFPRSDVQSLVFTTSTDVITLRNGNTFFGQYTGGSTLSFSDSQGIGYKFPLQDVASLVFSRHGSATPAATANAKIVPADTEISITTNELIESQNSSPGQLYSADVSADVPDASGGVAIPQGTAAKLVVRDISSGGAVHTPELVLDLFSVTISGKEYRVVSSDDVMTGRHGVGANRRTLGFAGGAARESAL